MHPHAISFVVSVTSGYTKSDYVFTRMVLFAYLGGLSSNIGNNAEEYTVSGSLPAVALLNKTCRFRGTQGNMAAWAWPVEVWELLDTDDDEISEEAELGGNAAADAAAAVGEGDPQEGGNIDGMLLLSQHFGDS